MPKRTANNGSFKAGNKGRPKGTPNKLTTSMRAAFQEAFDGMGGVDALIEWGKKNPGQFYPLASKLIPIDVTTGGERITVTFAPSNGGQAE